MIHHWDEFSKSLAEETVPRRESLRRIGAVLAGAVLSPFGLVTAFAGKPDPCKAFCNQCSNSKLNYSRCLEACRNCNRDPSRLCGSCWWGFACTNLANDVNNCGACGNACRSGPYEVSACFDGECVYACAGGAVDCDGTCSDLNSDPDNCGACAELCEESTPYCVAAACRKCPPNLWQCGNDCAHLSWDPNNCGACGRVCDQTTPICCYGECFSEEDSWLACSTDPWIGF